MVFVYPNWDPISEHSLAGNERSGSIFCRILQRFGGAMAVSMLQLSRSGSRDGVGCPHDIKRSGSWKTAPESRLQVSGDFLGFLRRSWDNGACAELELGGI